MEESKLNIGCIRFLKMNKDSMSCAHSNESRVVERLASRASKIESARCSSFRGVRNLTERKEFYPNFFRGLSAPIVGIFESTWDIDRHSCSKDPCNQTNIRRDIDDRICSADTYKSNDSPMSPNRASRMHNQNSSLLVRIVDQSIHWYIGKRIHRCSYTSDIVHVCTSMDIGASGTRGIREALEWQWPLD